MNARGIGERLIPIEEETQQSRASASLWLERKVRWIPLVVSATGYAMTFSLLFFAGEEGLRKSFNQCSHPCVPVDEILEVGLWGLALPGGSVVSSCIVTGIKALKTLCTQGCSAAGSKLAQSIRKNGLIRDAIAPDPRRILVLALDCASDDTI